MAGCQSKHGMSTEFAELMARANALEAERWAALPPIAKAFYSEDPDVAAATPEAVAAIRAAKNKISVEDVNGKGRTPPNPVTNFKQAFANYREPTPLTSEERWQNCMVTEVCTCLPPTSQFN